MKKLLDIRFFELVRIIRNNSPGMEDALYELVDSVHFTQQSIFHSNHWAKLVMIVDNKMTGIRLNSKETWYELATPALYMSIREMKESTFEGLYDEDFRQLPIDREFSGLYRLLRNLVANEIQKDLLDGNTIYEYTHREVEWPESPDEDDDNPAYDVFPDKDSIEDIAMDNLVLEQVRYMVSEMEWEIITAEHGDGPALAEKYDTTEGNIHQIKFRVINRLQEVFCNEQPA